MARVKAARFPILFLGIFVLAAGLAQTARGIEAGEVDCPEGKICLVVFGWKISDLSAEDQKVVRDTVAGNCALPQEFLDRLHQMGREGKLPHTVSPFKAALATYAVGSQVPQYGPSLDGGTQVPRWVFPESQLEGNNVAVVVTGQNFLYPCAAPGDGKSWAFFHGEDVKLAATSGKRNFVAHFFHE